MASEEIPKEGKAAVVVNEGADFTVEVKMVPVPEPGKHLTSHGPIRYDHSLKPPTDNSSFPRTRPTPPPPQRHRPLHV